MSSFSLERDLRTLSRRRMLGLLAGGALMVSCQARPNTTPPNNSCPLTNAETAGPYPADGGGMFGDTHNALTHSGIVRRDITTNTPGMTEATALGVPMTLIIKLVDANDGCRPLPNHAIYVWHCDRDGDYSLYSDGLENTDYLRGVQITDSEGLVRFESIFPACYVGRWPHVHFEVYADQQHATGADNALLVSQLALPQEVCDAVYQSTGYERSIRHFREVSLDWDNVFGDDGAKYQMADVIGDVTSGYTATLVVAI